MEKLNDTKQEMPFHKKWHFLFALVMTALLQQYATFCTIGLTYDSPFYIAAAQSFAEKWVFLDQNGRAYTNWTPLFPVLLSFFPNDVILWAKFLHLISCLATVFTLLLLSERLIHSWLLRVVFSLVIVFSSPLLLISSFLWSESVFVILLVVLLYFLFEYMNKDIAQWGEKTKFLLLILFSNLLYLQRNAGLFFIVAIGLCLFLQEISHRVFPKKSMIYTLLSLASFVIWQARNRFFVVNTLDFRDNVFEVSFAESFVYMMDIISLWLLPNILPLWFRLLFLAIFLIVLSYAFWKTKTLAIMYKKWNFLFVLALIFGVYIAFMLALRMNVEEENERYLAPLFPLFFLFLFIVLDLIIRQFSIFKTKIVVILLVLWLLYPIGRTLKNAHLWHKNQCKLSERIINIK